MQIKTILKTGAVALLVLSTGLVYAETNTVINIDDTMQAPVPSKKGVMFLGPPDREGSVKTEVKAGMKVDMKEMREDMNIVRPMMGTSTKDKIASSTKGRMEEREEKRDERMDEAKDRVKNQLRNRYQKMIERYQATIDRETTIMGKINTRISKIQATGATTTVAVQLVAEAKVHLDAAKVSLEALKVATAAQVNLETSSTTPKSLREGLEAMKKAGNEIEKHLREAHKLLQKSIGVLRGVSQLKPTATSTTNVNIQN